MITPGTLPALLLAQAAPAGGGSSLTPFLVQLVLIIAIIYFIMVRPQQKQRRKHEEALKALKRGDEIVTAGGIIGEVVHIKEAGGKGLDDRVTIKSGESRLVIERGRIARITGAAGTTSTTSASA
ncbi:MAG TPA: preprotein translocase subunit YajC [Gemmatimonadaceae bacterium]|nr:preprotein translocase subunit YajC [Gemmatimonadaceae bacterium]